MLDDYGTVLLLMVNHKSAFHPNYLEPVLIERDAVISKLSTDDIEMVFQDLECINYIIQFKNEKIANGSMQRKDCFFSQAPQ